MPSIPRPTAALGAALILGLLASALFDGPELGINVTLFAVALASTALTLASSQSAHSRAALVAAQ